MKPAKSNLQQTNQVGSIFFCSKRNWAQVPEIPQKTAEDKAIISPGTCRWLVLIDIGWVSTRSQIKGKIFLEIDGSLRKSIPFESEIKALVVGKI